ncbi:MAG TPA: nuclear transport factor 2 family protein [Actinomycetota bacterium]
MELSDLQSWIDAYIRAWETNHPQAVGDLFAGSARYYTHPFREPWTGREAIVNNWIEHPDLPGSWKASYRALAVNGNTGVVRGTTQYFKEDGSIDTEYANIYVIEFDDDGLATEFTEWFMEATPPPRE